MGEKSIKPIERALRDLRNGKFVLIYDNDRREGETDLVISSKFVEPRHIKTMRKDGGGLIFIMISNEIAEKLQLPFLAEMFHKIENMYPVLKELNPYDIPYDTKSSFSLYINHRKTFTGITDRDRSLTIRRFAELVENLINQDDSEKIIQQFGEEFRSPGHVPICIASKKPLVDRKGHTELSTILLKMADLIPIASGCEMMADDGNALSKKDAMKYAKEHDLVFLEGNEIVDAWERING
jgi:3,4-dihydroxy 2-butanone 4-phosphate synthase